MDIFTDQRFVPFLKTTTVTKYFPNHSLSQSSLKSNPVYKLLKNNELYERQQKDSFLQNLQHQEDLRRSSISLSETKFMKSKNKQRVKTLDSFFEEVQDNKKRLGKSKKSEEKFRTIAKLNEFSYNVERFQKSLKNQKNRCGILKKYKKMVERHFERFEPNEDRSRTEILHHEKLIRILVDNGEKGHSLSLKQRVDLECLSSSRREEYECVLEREKQLKQISSSLYCEKKIQKVVNNYLKDLSRSKSSSSQKKINIQRSQEKPLVLNENTVNKKTGGSVKRLYSPKISSGVSFYNKNNQQNINLRPFLKISTVSSYTSATQKRNIATAKYNRPKFNNNQTHNQKLSWVVT